MPKPKTKTELLRAGETNFKELDALIDSIPAERLSEEFSPGSLNRNLRDVVAHLHHWHLLFLGWYEVGMNGEKPPMPAEGYKWNDMPALNTKIRSEYLDVEREDARKLLMKSYSTIRGIISRHSDDELFEKKRYKWTGSTSLGAYLIANTSSHYNWAFKFIKKQGLHRKK